MVAETQTDDGEFVEPKTIDLIQDDLMVMLADKVASGESEAVLRVLGYGVSEHLGTEVATIDEIGEDELYVDPSHVVDADGEIEDALVFGTTTVDVQIV